jgi:hypothetical protein
MSTLVMNREIDRRVHDFRAKTRVDRAEFAAWALAIAVAVFGSLALGLASWSWFGAGVM